MVECVISCVIWVIWQFQFFLMVPIDEELIITTISFEVAGCGEY